MSDYTYDVIVKKVVDGDTADVDIDLGFDVWLKDQRVRFMGIDTPESRTTDKVEKVFGNYAKNFVNSFIPVGSKQTLLTFKDGTGKFGRILGDFLVEHEGKQVQLCQLMIDQHVGVAYFGQSKNDIEDEHLANRKYLIENNTVQLD
jgi:micrococcal nuclease|tara:strand:- start:2578 stop:3015 length:438 start_codon:yes stop_codon:yes gene_type:complete